MKVLVYGLSKSGTTILHAQVFDAVNKHQAKAHQEIFEPRSISVETGRLVFKKNVGRAIPAEQDFVVKSLFDSGIPPGSVLEHGHRFERKIFVLRDPRDRMISGFFYRWYRRHDPNEAQFERALRLIRHKEQHPSDIPFFFLNAPGPHGQKAIANAQKALCDSVIDFVKQLDETWLVLKYEDIVDGNVDALEKYLGCPISPDTTVKKTRRRVSRTEAYGNWRSWFTADDVVLFRSVFTPFLKEFQYDPADWRLCEPDSLPDREGSRYMEELYYGKGITKRRLNTLLRLRRGT